MAPARSPSLAVSGLTALYLPGGIAVGLGAALPVSAIPTAGHPHLVRNVLSGVILLVAVFLASRAWGRVVGARTGCPDPARMGRVAGFAFAPVLMAAGITLGLLEPVFVGAGAARGLPLHVVFRILFMAATLLVAGVTAAALTAAAGRRAAALRVGLEVGVGGGLAFFLAALGMDALGWRVGAPGAAERATMLVVTLVGCLAAALAAGGVLGARLSGPSRARDLPASGA